MKKEVDPMMQEMENRIMEELKKMNQKLSEEAKIRSDSQDRKIGELVKEHNQEIAKLQKKNDELQSQLEDLRKKHEGHFELFHRTKFTLKPSISPQMSQKSDQIDYCYESDSFRFRFDFSILSGPGKDDKNTPIDFGELKMMFNGVPFSRFKIGPNSIEFDLTFTKIGRNELTCFFHNINKTFLIDVEPASLCSDKCELLFYRLVDLEPDGNLTRSTLPPTEKFLPSDNIQIIMQLLNENGVPLLPKFLEEELLNIMMFKMEGKKKKMIKEARGHDICIDQVDSKGEFCVCTIQKNSLEKGTYLVKVDGCEIDSKKKSFEIE